MKAPFLLLALACAALPRAVYSDEAIGVVAVAPPPAGPGDDVVNLSAQLRQSLARRTTGVLEAGELRARMGGQAGEATLAETDRSYEAARAADLSGDPLRAVAGLRSTIAALEAMPASDEAFAQWTRAMLRLARSESDLAGHEERVQAVLERLLRAAPDVEVDPAVHGPSLAREVAAVRAKLAALPRRTLSVNSTSPDVRVFVEGRGVGTVPVAVALPPGRYRVAGVKGGLQTPPALVDLADRDQTLTLDLAVAEILRPGQGPGLAVAPVDRARLLAAGAFLRLDTLIATELVEEGGAASHLVATAYDVQGGKPRHSGVIRLFDQAPAVGAMSALADLLLGKGPVPGVVAEYDHLKPKLPGLGLDPLRQPPGGPAKTLGWAAFSTGIATVGLAGVSVWQAIRSKNESASANALLLAGGVLPGNATQYEAHRSASESASRVAIVTGVGAGACAVATGIMGYLAYKQTGEIGPFRF